MELKETVNGLEVTARYSDESVEGIFRPLIARLGELQEQKGARLLVFLAAPPAAGKSTLATFLQHLSEDTPDAPTLQSLGMDGFHRRQDYLDTHLMTRDGREVPMASLKGAPETFDLTLLAAALESVAQGDVCGWPAYDRTIHDPLDDAFTVDADIVLIEGNYLLLDEEGWRELEDLADYTIAIEADPAFLRDRLVSRKAQSGISLEDAEAFVERSDLHNARTVLDHSRSADLTLRLLPDGSYVAV